MMYLERRGRRTVVLMALGSIAAIAAYWLRFLGS